MNELTEYDILCYDAQDTYTVLVEKSPSNGCGKYAYQRTGNGRHYQCNPRQLRKT